MQIKTSVLAAVAGLTAAAGLAFTAVPASAADAQMKDSDYLSLARCAGLAQGLGGDAAPYDKVLEDQRLGRDAVVIENASAIRSDTQNAARHASGQRKAKFESDRDGVCKSYIG